MQVPPPYVPPIGGGVVPSPAQDRPMPSAPTARVEGAGAGQRARTATGRRTFFGFTPREAALAAILMLAFAALPTALPTSELGARAAIESDASLQDVERPEANFAGSAFYFIDPGYAIPMNYGPSQTGIDAGDGTGLLPGAIDDQPAERDSAAASARAIRPIAFSGTPTDNARALECLTSAIYYEAGLEPDAGQRAVAQVILNRVRHPSYPGTVCGVIFQGSERRTGCQFSYTCDGSLARKPARFHWTRAARVAALALSGRMPSPVGTATHYHATYVYPYWAPSLRFLGTIGAHRFYSWKGSAGRASAFGNRYRGGEPVPAPKPRRADPAPALDPIALEKAYEAGLAKAREEARKAEADAAAAADTARRHDLTPPVLTPGTPRRYRAPVYSEDARARGGEKAFAGHKLPDVSRVRPEYRDSGSWKKQPGS